MEFDHFRMDAVNRCRAITGSVAGKGPNVAHAVAVLGARAIVVGFIGGHTGKLATADLRRHGVDCRFVRLPVPTRVCTTILDHSTGQITELVEEAPVPSRPAWQQFHRQFKALLPRADLLTISGTLLPGAPATIYRDFARAAGKLGIPVVIDSQKAPLLHALVAQPLLAKLNVHELGATVGRDLRTPSQIVAAGRELIARGAQHVLITHGARGAWIVCRGHARHFQPPKVKTLNPIGSGDSVTAGIAVGLLDGMRLPDAVARGIACGTANATTLTPATFEPRVARGLVKRIRVSS
jgi:1-phosphofructokinase family hexose kinase